MPSPDGNTQSFKFNFRVAGKKKIIEINLLAKMADRRRLFKAYKTISKQTSTLKETSTAPLLRDSHFSATFSRVHFCNISILEKKIVSNVGLNST